MQNLTLIDKDMNWNFILAKGTAGGVLVGFKNQLFDIVSWQYFEFCVVTIVTNQIDNLNWRLTVVYGVGILQTGYLCIQASSQDKEQDMHPRAATYPVAPDLSSPSR
jgi:hypothetical protein